MVIYPLPSSFLAGHRENLAAVGGLAATSSNGWGVAAALLCTAGVTARPPALRQGVAACSQGLPRAAAIHRQGVVASLAGTLAWMANCMAKGTSRQCRAAQRNRT